MMAPQMMWQTEWLPKFIHIKNMKLDTAIDVAAEKGNKLLLSVISSYDTSDAAEYAVIEELRRENNCSICLQSVSPEYGKVTPCRHLFHRACLSEWVKPTCPMCR